MKDKPPVKLDRTEIAVRFAMSGLEIAVYIIAPIIIGYLLTRDYGPLAIMCGLLFGALLGLVLAVRRAMKMTL